MHINRHNLSHTDTYI